MSNNTTDTLEERAERSEIICGYIQQIMLCIDLLNCDGDNLDHLKNVIDKNNDRVSLGYSVPAFDYSRVDKLRADMELLEALYRLCISRKEHRHVLINAETSPPADLLSVLGF